MENTMSVSSIGSTPVHPPARPAAPQVSNDQSKFKAGLARQATAAQKSAVEIAQPTAASVHRRA